MRLVSISSRVAWGHVGNASLVFPLQRLGCEVVSVDTVLFSNHLGYGSYAGPVVPGAEVTAILAQLERLGVLGEADGLISGFLGEAPTAEAVAGAVARLRQTRPDYPYLLDPVLGDHGRLYVPESLATAVARHLVPLASLMTPNPFELETLTGQPVLGETATLAAAKGLLSATTRAVLVTSAHEEEARVGLLLVTAERCWRLWTPRYRFSITPNGSGDLLAGLWLLESLRQPDLLTAARLAVARLLAVIARTAAEDRRELLLVAAQEDLVRASAASVTVEVA